MSNQLVQYGDVQFPFTKVQSNEQYVYDTDDRTVLGTRYDFTISGWIAGDSAPDFRDRLNNIRSKIHEPRQNFRIVEQTSGVSLFSYGPSNVSDWGPRTQSFNTVEFAGMNSCRYTWSVEVFVKECETEGVDGDYDTIANDQHILNITRTWSFSIDVTGLNTRSVSGSLKVTKNGTPADQYRHLCAPVMPAQFRRIQQQYSTSPDGRTLTFNIVDQEMMYTLPEVISDGEVTWSTRIAPLGGQVHYTLSGRLRLPRSETPGVNNKFLMFEIIKSLIDDKFPLDDPDATLIFNNASIDDSMFDQELTFSISASDVALGERTESTQAMIASYMRDVLTRVTITPSSSTGLSYLTKPYGTAPTEEGNKARVTEPWNACTQAQNDAGELGQFGIGVNELGDEGQITQIGQGFDLVDRTDASDQNKSTPYVAFHERVSFELDNKIVSFDAKIRGRNPIIVQTANAALYITQAGYYTVLATEQGVLPAPPKPLVPNVVMVHSSVEPIVPEIVGAGMTNLYTLHWRYIMRVPVAFDAGDEANLALGYRFPKDPRRRSVDDSQPWTGTELNHLLPPT